MDTRESDLLRLIDCIYETIEDPGQWSVFLEEYARILGARFTFFQRHEFTRRRSSMARSYGLASPLNASYNAHYGRLNIWRDKGERHYVEGRVVLDPEVVSREVLVKTEFYNDCLVRFDGVHSIAGVIARTPTDAFVLSAMSDQRHGPWQPDDKRFVEVLLPHLRRAYAVQEQLQIAEAGRAVLNTFDIGVVFLTRDLVFVTCNQFVEQMLERQDGFLLRAGVFRAVDAISQDQLVRAVSRAAAVGTSVECPSAAVIKRPGTQRPFQVVAAPLRGRLPALNGLRTPEVVLLIVDPDCRRAPISAVLQQIYGLTPREAALAAALAAGQTVEQAAHALQMKYETARGHLRHIFSKTSTSRQSELVVLLSRLTTAAHGEG